MEPGAERERLCAQAMRWLARREYSVQELAQRLQTKGFASGEVMAVMTEFQEQNLVSDRRFTESLVRGRVERGQGPLKIAHDLRAKGVDEALVDEFVDAGSELWGERLRTVWAKRFGRPPDSYREWARQARGLQRLGFSAEQVRRVVPDIDT